MKRNLWLLITIGIPILFFLFANQWMEFSLYITIHSGFPTLSVIIFLLGPLVLWIIAILKYIK